MRFIKTFESHKSSISYENTLSDIESRIDYKELLEFDEDDLDKEYFLRVEKGIIVDSNGNVEFDTLDEGQAHLIGNNFVKLYHFTSGKFEKSIREIGLVKGMNKTNPHGNSYSGIYLTTETSGPVIDGYKHHIRKHGANIIRIEIKMYLSELTPDIDDEDLKSGDTQFIASNISPDRIIDIEEVY